MLKYLGFNIMSDSYIEMFKEIKQMQNVDIWVILVAFFQLLCSLNFFKIKSGGGKKSLVKVYLFLYVNKCRIKKSGSLHLFYCFLKYEFFFFFAHEEKSRLEIDERSMSS